MAEIPTLHAHRPLVLRHRKAAMYHPFIEAAAMTLVDIPITLATLTAYCTLVYPIVGLQASASQFLYVIPGSFFPRSLNSHFGGSIFFPLVFTIALIMKAYFRAIAAWFTDPTPYPRRLRSRFLRSLPRHHRIQLKTRRIPSRRHIQAWNQTDRLPRLSN